MKNTSEEFRDAIIEKIGCAPSEIIGDGKIRRFSTSKTRRNDSGWAVLFDDEFPAGSFGNWSTGERFTWSGRDTKSLPPDEKKRLDEVKAERQRKQDAAFASAAASALKRWNNAPPANEDHVYLKKKGVASHGLRANYGQLIVPVYVGDEICSIQTIDENGNKIFAKDSRTKGGYFRIGSPGSVMIIAEGYATCASIFEATDIPVVVAFNAGNLLSVSTTMREKFPSAKIVIAADDDFETEAEKGFNPGKREAQKAAEAVGGIVVAPPFDRKAGDGGTDWNDYAVMHGNDALKAAFTEALTTTETQEQEQRTTAEIVRLADLPRLAYDREREAVAKKLKVRVSTIDKEVEARRQRADDAKAIDLCADIEPCAEPVVVADLLDDIRNTVSRFIICGSDTMTAAALWIAFTWTIEHVQVAPLAIITAPEKRCGKSQLLDLIGRLSRRRLFASNISPAATFRVIEAKSPTLLIDEADAFFRDNEELRGVINSGHTRTSAYVIRTVGDNHDVKQFSTWGAKCIAGIGRLPETVMDRAIILPLRRKLPSEKVERLRHAEDHLFGSLAARLARFGEDHAAEIGRRRPALPDTLNDRQQDNWEPLLSIADLAGGHWPKEARRAALSLSGAERDATSTAEELLSDIRAIFEGDHVGRISMAELLRRLPEDELAPWATWNRGRPMTARQLGARLKEFGIQAVTVHIGQYDKPKGFKREQFADAWSRYLDGANEGAEPQDIPSPDTPSSSVTRSPSAKSGPVEVTEEVTDESGFGHRAAESPAAEKVTLGEGDRGADRQSPEKSPENLRFSRQGDRVTDETRLPVKDTIQNETVIEI